MKIRKSLGVSCLAVLATSAALAQPVKAQNYFPIWNPITGKFQTAPRADEQNIKFLVVELKTINVLVVDENGKPIPGANLTLTPASYLYPYPASFDPYFSVTGVNGRARFNELLLGDYKLTASAAGYEPSEVDETTNPVIITLKSAPDQDYLLTEF